MRANKTCPSEETLYEEALKEVQSGNLRPGLWAKAFAEAEGDEKRQKAVYLKLRVAEEKARTTPPPLRSSLLAKFRNLRLRALFFSFRGRIRRRSFWFCMAILWTLFILVLAALDGIGRERGADAQTVLVLFILLPASIFLGWSILALIVKRCHDLGWPWYYVFGSLIPILNLVFWVNVLWMPGKYGANDYGPNPRISLESCDLKSEQSDAVTTSHKGGMPRMTIRVFIAWAALLILVTLFPPVDWVLPSHVESNYSVSRNPYSSPYSRNPYRRESEESRESVLVPERRENRGLVFILAMGDKEVVRYPQWMMHIGVVVFIGVSGLTCWKFAH